MSHVLTPHPVGKTSSQYDTCINVDSTPCWENLFTQYDTCINADSTPCLEPISSPHPAERQLHLACHMCWLHILRQLHSVHHMFWLHTL